MADVDDPGLLLGKSTPVIEQYSPELLFPIARSQARNALGIDPDATGFYGEDIWHAYELSWLTPGGKPVVRLGRFRLPASSPNIVESKSFKLYLNSLNFHCFADDIEAVQCMEADLSSAAGAPVTLELAPITDERWSGMQLDGQLLDDLEVGPLPDAPDAALLNYATDSEATRQVYHSHLLRSLCPVTAQPDWASVRIELVAAPLEPESLLRYLLGFRHHQEFHEQCVERIYMGLCDAPGRAFLSVQALYTRRGGLDINPWRCSEPGSAPAGRMNRQ